MSTGTGTGGVPLAAARGALLSAALRLASFLLTQLTVRIVPAAALGRASVRLELLAGTALFVGREGFRLALTKELDGEDGDGNGGDEGEEGGDEGTGTRGAAGGGGAGAGVERRRRQQRSVNVSWLSVPAGAALSALALAVHLRRCGGDVDPGSDDGARDEYEQEHELLDYKLAGILYCLASFVESLAEPLVIRCLQRIDVTTKAKAEGAALVMKSASCFGCLYLMRCGWLVNVVATIIGGGKGGADAAKYTFAVTAFGVAQLVYASVFTITMYRRGSPGGIRWPKRISIESSPIPIQNPYREKGADSNHTTIKETSPTPFMAQNLDLHTLYLVALFTLQGLFKHALTEADKIVLSALAGSYDQGVYALAASYGGLAARLLLQPMEENARLLFARQGAMVSAAERRHDSGGGEKGGGNSADDGEEKETTSRTALDLLDKLEETYLFLIRLVVYIGLLFAAIASNYTSVLLRLLAGSRWGSNAEASAALSAFCVYTAFLALNGITEAFVYGVARSGNDVGKLGVVHAVVGATFALVAPGLVRSRGAVGLVAANCVAMALRSAYSFCYARRYFALGRCAEGGTTSVAAGTLARATPHFAAMGAFALSFAITRLSRNCVYDARVATGGSWIVAGTQHIVVGIICVVATGAVSLWFERGIRSSLIQLIKRKRD